MKVQKKSAKQRGVQTPIVTAGSYSRLSDYERCPGRVRFKAAGHDDGSATAQPLIRGKRIHSEGEDYLNTPKMKLPASYKYFKKEMVGLRKRKALAEISLAFRREWVECEWMDPEVWMRCKIDVLILRQKSAEVRDFKTGKMRDDHVDQLGLYALGVFMSYPGIDTVTSGMMYLDTGDEIEVEFTRELDLEDLDEDWTRRNDKMIADTVMKCTPLSDPYCQYCPFHAKKDGPCKEGV